MSIQRSATRLLERHVVWWVRHERETDERLDALYERLVTRYWRPIIGFTVGSTLVMLWGALTVATAYFRITWAQVGETGAFISACIVVAVLWTHVAVRRGPGKPIFNWVTRGRPEAGAGAAWKAATNLPFVSVWKFASWRIVVAAVIPLGAYVKLAYSATWLEAVSDACSLAAALPGALAFEYLALDLLIRPLKRDAARRCRPEIGPPRPLASMRWRLLVTMTAIGAGAAEIAALLAAPAHVTLKVVAVDVPVGAGVGAILAVGLSVMFTDAVVGPLDDLVRATDGIRAGDLSARVLVTSGDELGILASSFNSMAGELQRGREQMVSAREEERRRLRRDLHDDLGPTLAALVMQLELVGDLIERDPAQARRLIGELKLQARDGIADIRRVVYELRPPALDELGLVGAIRENALRLTAGGGAERPKLTLNAPDELPQLPAAVEVAAFRIAQEALTNLVRHAGASACTVDISLNGGLELVIQDDGAGIQPDHDVGVGLASMRERAAELGGVLAIESAVPRGTIVRVRLPLPA